jgi:hypothetical protein
MTSKVIPVSIVMEPLGLFPMAMAALFQIGLFNARESGLLAGQGCRGKDDDGERGDE